MKIFKQLVSVIALAAALGTGAAGCGRDGGAPPGTVGGTGGGGGPAMVPLVAWVTDLAVSYPVDTSTPDTVDDKVSIVTDTSDPAAFDPLLQQQPQN
jgi:hypothetical protein